MCTAATYKTKDFYFGRTLMTTMILEKQTRFTIDAYKRIAELEAKLA